MSGNMRKKTLIFTAGTLCLIFAVPTFAQVQTRTSTAYGQATKEVTIESGEVVAVEGNDLFVKMSDGTLRHFPNIPASARVNVDGQQLGVSQLRPGMKLQRATVKTTMPQVVTTIQTVTGKVWHVTPPISVILTLENGENQAFKIPEGTKFTVGGQETDAWGLKKGMTVTATKIVETPVTAVSQHTQVTGTLPPGSTVLVAKGGPTKGGSTSASSSGGTDSGGASTGGASTGETTTTASTQLPKTATGLPLVGILGLLLILTSLGMSLLRRSLRL